MNRQAGKAGKEETAEKNKVKKVSIGISFFLRKIDFDQLLTQNLGHDSRKWRYCQIICTKCDS